MRNFEVITINDCEKWDSIVHTFEKYDIYYLSGYAKAFQYHGDGDPFLFYYNDSKLRAINVVMKRDIALCEYFVDKIPLNKYFDITTPYGYGGFILEGDISKENIENLNIIYTDYCKSNNIISEICRFHPILGNYKDAEIMYKLKRIGKTISLDLSSKNIIWDNFISQCRNKVRKAKKNGVEIFWEQNYLLYEDFMRIYNQTMKRDNAKDYYYFDEKFYEILNDELKYNVLVFYAKHEKEIIAMSIMLCCNDKMHYHLTGSLREYINLAPLNLLLYEAACWGSANNYKTLHLGGGLGAQEDNLYVFKSSFNRNSDNSFIIGSKIFDEEKYNILLDKRRASGSYEENTSFFPEYRG